MFTTVTVTTLLWHYFAEKCFFFVSKWQKCVFANNHKTCSLKFNTIGHASVVQKTEHGCAAENSYTKALIQGLVSFCCAQTYKTVDDFCVFLVF